MKCQHCEGRGFYYAPVRPPFVRTMPATKAAEVAMIKPVKMQCHVCRGSGFSEPQPAEPK